MSLTETLILQMENNESLHIEGVYTPEEPMVRYYKDGSGHPGSPAEFEIDKVFYHTKDGKEFDVTELFEFVYTEELCSWEDFSDKLVKVFQKQKDNDL